MPIDLGQLDGWVGGAMWALARISGLMLVAPVLGSTMIPMRIRLGLTVLLTMVLAPLAPLDIRPLSAAGVAVMSQQVLIGAALGFILKLVFEAVAFGGQFLSQAMSLGFAETVNPGVGGTTPVISQFYTMLVTLMFLVLNGHLQLISLLADSFRSMPVGDGGIGADGLWGVLSFASHLFSGAVRVALPALTAVLVVNLGFGAISRSAPSMNLFAVGFPITICLGVLAVWLSLRALPGAFDSLQTAAWDTMRQLIGR
ncbi:MAG: flagellar biosynthetic protein FliR [Luteibacter sp.]|uniref:flagellar biosynthetic protein FliR n=1 Tax=Rhodanobacteraceae TaxID=1775411 RepID=UPI000888A1ED|nr:MULTISPECIES: flagellar biosynthetic protein FliR [Rhodanobacteraceae]MDQ7997030.1 flagellar biosynthetic protein FliR [Luteibacter sp.]MDQ8050899.1 flagellar biosynthetic protein FliR [Luteibacter sp.]SDF10123.1 flagellar biosynthetic protein FliR [Dyella sp. 333MFSha]